MDSLRREYRITQRDLTAVGENAACFEILKYEAARRMARAIERGVSFTVIPWQMGVVAKLLRLFMPLDDKLVPMLAGALKQG